jgi:hypothetical protein
VPVNVLLFKLKTDPLPLPLRVIFVKFNEAVPLVPFTTYNAQLAVIG